MKALVLFLAAFAISTSAMSDSWRMPTPYTYSSGAGKYRLTIYPSKLNRKLGDPACQATLEVFHGNRYRQLWRRNLISDIRPVDAVVSDRDGRFVTLDNWLSRGYGTDTVVIYTGQGRVVRQLALSDFLSDTELDSLTRSVSSIWWRGYSRIAVMGDDEGFVEENEVRDEVVEIEVIFGQDLTGFEKHSGRRLVRIRLRDGAIINK